MILKGSQRAGARQLAAHLMNSQDNDHVTVHEVRGFIASTLPGALDEAYAVSRATKCKQFLFSVSLSPPSSASVPVPVFESAIQEIEKAVGLVNQPRVIVFHEKQGRWHAHCVWSRINADTMTSTNLPLFKLRLRKVSQQLYREYGWTMPRGLMDSQARNPLNFNLVEWQQAKRAQADPKALKSMFEECWAASDSAASFRSALEERGFYLARGDQRGHVALDWQGEVFSLSRWVGVPAKRIRERLGDTGQYPGIADVRTRLSSALRDKGEAFREEEAYRRRMEDGRREVTRRALVVQQRAEREKLRRSHLVRSLAEKQQRSMQLPRGIRALWLRITGRYGRVRDALHAQAAACDQRDLHEMQGLIERQLEERRLLRENEKATRRDETSRRAEVDDLIRELFGAHSQASPPRALTSHRRRRD